MFPLNHFPYLLGRLGCIDKAKDKIVTVVLLQCLAGKTSNPCNATLVIACTQAAADRRLFQIDHAMAPATRRPPRRERDFQLVTRHVPD